MALIILQVGPKSVVNTWRTADAESFIEDAELYYGMVYEAWNAERANKTFGRGLVPHDLALALEDKDEVVEVNWGNGDNPNLFSVLQAPTKFDVAKQAVFHGTTEGYVLSEGDAQAFVEGRLNLVVDDGIRELCKRSVSSELRIIQVNSGRDAEV